VGLILGHKLSSLKRVFIGSHSLPLLSLNRSFIDELLQSHELVVSTKHENSERAGKNRAIRRDGDAREI
jgi:hypothetical protein